MHQLSFSASAYARIFLISSQFNFAFFYLTLNVMYGHANNWRTKRKNLVVVKFVILSFIFFAFFSPFFFLFNDNCLGSCSKLSNKWHLVRLCVFNKAKSALKQTKLCRLRGFLPLNCRRNFPAKGQCFFLPAKLILPTNFVLY